MNCMYCTSTQRKHQRRKCVTRAMRLRNNFQTLALDTPPSSPVGAANNASILFLEESNVGIGQVERFNIRFHYEGQGINAQVEEDDEGAFLWLRVRNHENNLFRPIYITGPFALYVDVTPHNYAHETQFTGSIQYHTDVKPGQSFKAKLRLDEGSAIGEGWFGWKVDVVSQVTLSTTFHVNFVLKVGYNYRAMSKASRVLDTTSNPCRVAKWTTKDIWSKPPRHPERPVHLVVITHGIFSNIGADMLYIRDRILENGDPEKNVIVRGCDSNVGKSDCGIRYLGSRVAEYVLKFCEETEYTIGQISFIGHSLGGPVQAFAIAHIVSKDPQFFQRIHPDSLITLASPMLGLTEFPKAVSWALDIGMLGKTGRDLTLRRKFPSLIPSCFDDSQPSSFTTKPVLQQIMLNRDVHHVFASFQKRTLYANAIHDGIVPLRTSALLYLDWKGLGDIERLKKQYEEQTETRIEKEEGSDIGERAQSGHVEEIPEERTQNNVRPILSKELIHAETKTEGKELRNKSTTTSFFFTEASKRQKRKKMRKYLRTQTVSSTPVPSPELDSLTDAASRSVAEMSSSTSSDDLMNIHIPPVASTVLTAANALISPEPTQDFLTSPAARFPSIFHDRVYTFDDLPPQHYDTPAHDTKGPFSRLVSRNKKALQEAIARSWHEDMAWRKVLVTLRPDAHNNIAVRRRYVNAWGWQVIDHLVENHF